MKRLAYYAAVGSVCASCGVDTTNEGESGGPSITLPPPTMTAPFPSPMNETCSAACAKLEVDGPVSELVQLAPGASDRGQSTITFGGDHWYVAWAGVPAVMTQVQRFTKDGKPVGARKRIDGTMPEDLEFFADAQGRGQVLLWGSIPRAYPPMRAQASLHRFDAELSLLGSPLQVRSPDRVFGSHTTELVQDTLTTTVRLPRTVPLVREVTIDLASVQTPTIHDWHVPEAGAQAAPTSIYERIGDGRFLVFYSKRAIRIARLEDDGIVAAPAPKVLEANFEDDNVVVLSRRVGGAWWVGGFSARGRGATTLHLVRVDPEKRTPIADSLVFAWPTGSPRALIDANGTPMLSATIGEQPVMIPIDVEKRALCRPMRVFLDGRTGQQEIRSIHFFGGVAGVTIDSWEGTPRKMVFARLACRAN